MRIAFDGLNIRKGGGQTVLVRLARAFASHGHTIIVFTASDAIAQDLLAGGITGIEIETVPAAVSAIGALKYRYQSWDKACRRHNCDAAFGFNYWIPTKLPQVTYHINVIPFLPWAERKAAVGTQRAIIQKIFAQKALQKSQLNLFESHHVMELAKAASTKPIRNADVKYIGVDLPQDVAPSAGHDNYIAAVTSPTFHKHNEHLFALHRLLNEHAAEGQKIGLKLIGIALDDMDTQPATRAEKPYAAGDPSIEFLGYVDRHTLYSTLSRALALVSFSELESFYMVALEAMAVGCPTVTTDVSSIRESVGSAGITVPTGDIQQAALAVESLLDKTTWDRLVGLGYQHTSKFSAETCASDIVKTVQQQLGPMGGQSK